MANRLIRGGLITVLLMSVVLQSLNAPVTSAASALHYLFGSGSQTGGKSITFRIQLTEPAPSSGAIISLAASSPTIAVPTTTTIASGASEKTISVATSPVATDALITISATYAGVTKSRSVLIKAPVLTSLGLQTVIRHGGVGKVIARISGPAPVGGFPVTTSTDPDGYLGVDPVIIVLEGQTQLSMPVSANLFGPADIALPDQPLSLTISAGNASFTKSTIIRDFGDDPRPTSTVTHTPTETATATATNTPTETATVTSTPDPVSSGCRYFMSGSADGMSNVTFLDNPPFYAGERVKWAITGSAVQTRVRFRPLDFNDTDIDTISPGSNGYTIPLSQTYMFISWSTTGENVTWDFDCIPAGTPTATPTGTPTNTSTPTRTPTNTPVPSTNTPTSAATATIINQPSGIQVNISLATNPTLIVGEFTMVDVCMINTTPGKDATLSFTISDDGNPGGNSMELEAANDSFCGDPALLISRSVPGEYWVTATLHVAGYIDQVFESPHFNYLPANTPTPTSTRDPISDGCEFFNSGAADGPIDTGYADNIQLFQGETIHFSATGTSTPVRIRFRDNMLTTISIHGFNSPGGSSYNIPFSQIWGEIEWTGFGTTVTWDFRCTPAP